MMDIMEKVNELAQTVGDKANELVEYGRLNAQIYSENSEVETLKKQIGEACFGKYRAGDVLDPELENLCRQIERHKRSIAEKQRQMHQMKADAAAERQRPAAGEAGFCPYCGAALVPDASFCPKCGRKTVPDGE